MAIDNFIAIAKPNINNYRVENTSIFNSDESDFNVELYFDRTLIVKVWVEITIAVIQVVFSTIRICTNQPTVSVDE